MFSLGDNQAAENKEREGMKEEGAIIHGFKKMYLGFRFGWPSPIAPSV